MTAKQVLLACEFFSTTSKHTTTKVNELKSHQAGHTTKFNASDTRRTNQLKETLDAMPATPH